MPLSRRACSTACTCSTKRSTAGRSAGLGVKRTASAVTPASPATWRTTVLGTCSSSPRVGWTSVTLSSSPTEGALPGEESSAPEAERSRVRVPAVASPALTRAGTRAGARRASRRSGVGDGGDFGRFGARAAMGSSFARSSRAASRIWIAIPPRLPGAASSAGRQSTTSPEKRSFSPQKASTSSTSTSSRCSNVSSVATKSPPLARLRSNSSRNAEASSKRTDSLRCGAGGSGSKSPGSIQIVPPNDVSAGRQPPLTRGIAAARGSGLEGRAAPPARCGHKRREQAALLGLHLRVPLDCEHPRVLWHLDGLDAAVRSPGGRREAAAQTIDRLVVPGDRLDFRRPIDLRQMRAGVEAHGVRDWPTLGVAVQHPFPEDVGQMHVQIASPRDVQHLESAADRENGHLPLEGALHQLKLEPVSLLVNAVLCWMRLRLEMGGVEVPASGEEEAVDVAQDVLGSLLSRRQEQGDSPARAYAVHVRGGKEERRAVGSVTRIGGDADQGPPGTHLRLTCGRARAPTHSPLRRPRRRSGRGRAAEPLPHPPPAMGTHPKSRRRRGRAWSERPRDAVPRGRDTRGSRPRSACGSPLASVGAR